jgi:hypothetical protein
LVTDTLPFQAAEPASAWKMLVPVLMPVEADKVLSFTDAALENTEESASPTTGVPDTVKATAESDKVAEGLALKVDCRLLRLTLPVLPAVGVPGLPMAAPSLLKATVLLAFAVDT